MLPYPISRSVRVTGSRAGAIERRVDDGHILIHSLPKEDRLLLDLFHKSGKHLIGNVGNLSFGQAFLKVCLFHIPENIQLLNFTEDFCGRLGSDLAAVRSVYLVAVVLAGIVRGRDHHACAGSQIAGGKGDGRHRQQAGPDMHRHPIGCKHLSRHPGKQLGFDPAVISNGHRGLFRRLIQVVCQALGSLCNGVNIHSVGTSSDDTAESTRAEGQIPVEGILNFGIIHGL